MAEATSVKDVFRKVRDLLATAELGYVMATSPNPTVRLPGFYNVAVFGRTVTFALQNLKTVVGAETYDEWYEPLQNEMRTSELCRYFRDLRNEILKEGPPPTRASMYVEYLNPGDLAKIPRPPGAKNFFMGDHIGGNGWEVEMPDGTTTKYYVALPPEIKVTNTLHAPSAPGDHLGTRITDTSIGHVSRLYLDYLTDIVDRAERHFSA